MSIETVTDANYDEFIKSEDKAVLINFSATWCAPCQAAMPGIIELSESMSDKIKVGKVDVDSSPVKSANMHVRGVPTYFIYKSGEVIAQKVGGISKESMKQWLEENIS